MKRFVTNRKEVISKCFYGGLFDNNADLVQCLANLSAPLLFLQLNPVVRTADNKTVTPTQDAVKVMIRYVVPIVITIAANLHSLETTAGATI